LLDVAIAPRGVMIPLSGARLLDPLDRRPLGRDELLLGVGLDGRSRETLRVLEAIADGAGAGLVLRAPGAVSPEVLDEAGRLGVAILVAPHGSEWGPLHALIDAATSRRPHAPHAPHVVDALDVAGEDLPALADATAALAGGSVTILDARLRVLALACCDGGEVHAPARAVADTIAARAAAAADVVGVDVAGGSPCRAIAIRAATTVLGYAWATAVGEPLGAHADAALREAARRAAPTLLRRRTVIELECDLRAELLARLLADGDSADACAAGLQLRVPARYTVIAYDLGCPDRDRAALAASRAVDLVSLLFRSHRRDAFAVADAARVTALVADEPDGSRDALARIARESVASMRAMLKLPVRGGIGTSVAAPQEVHASRLAAEQALRVGGDDLQALLVDIEEVRGEALLHELAAYVAAHPRPPSKPLARLHEHDRDHGTRYVETLTAYLDCFGDSARTAKRLKIHRNTLRYRIRRLAELAPVDFDQPLQRFALEAQLRLSAPARSGRG